MKILLVDDDFDPDHGARIALARQWADVVWVRRLDEALRALGGGAFDMVLLDPDLPDGDGLDLLRHLNHDGHDRALPVLVLVKPLALPALLSRMRALSGRDTNPAESANHGTGLALHEPTHGVIVDGELVPLSRCEFDLLAMLLQRVGCVVTRRVMARQALAGGLAGDAGLLELHMSNLRRKIGHDYIRAVRGIGYVLADPASRYPVRPE